MSGLGEKIKAALGGGHSSEAERGEVDHRTPGAFPEDSTAHGGVDQPHIGTKPVPSSGQRDLGGTSQDPGLISGSSEHNKEGSTHNKLHKKDDPRGNTSYPAHDSTSTSGLGHSHNTEPSSGVRQPEHGSTNPLSSSTHPSSHNESSLATDRSGRPDSSSVPGTGYAGGATGLQSHELGGDHSGQRTEGLPGSTTTSTTGTTGASSGLTGADTSATGISGHTRTGNAQPESNTGRDAGLAGATAATAGALVGHGGDHNKVGQRGVKSEVTSEEPYWGDLPQGAGVYNTVTGHGSGEDTSGQHRTIPRTGDSSEASKIHSSGDHHLPQGAGVYNTVTGHGSNRDAHEHTSSSGQREFPLTSSSVHGGASGTAVGSDTAGSRVGGDSHHDRHLGEAGALGAGAAAYGAHEHNKHNNNTTGSTTGTSSTGNREGDHGPHSSRIANALDPRVDSDRDGSKTTGNIGTTSTAPGVSGTGPGSNSLTHPEADSSHRSHHLGEAGALGAGTAAYGAHEHSKHGREAEHNSRGATTGTSGITGSRLRSNTASNREDDSGPHDSRIANALDPRVDSDRDGSRATGNTGVSNTHGTSSATSGTSGAPTVGDNSHRDRHIAEAGAIGAGAAAYGAHDHHKHAADAGYDAQRAAAPGHSTTHHTGSGLDPTSTNQPRDASHSGGLLHRHKDQTEPVAQTEKDKTGHSHEHGGILGLFHRNKDPKDIDQPAHEKSHFTTHHGDADKSALTGAPGATQTTSHATSSGLGRDPSLASDATRSGHEDSHTGRNVAGLGAAAGAGYGASQWAHHHDNEPQTSSQFGSGPTPQTSGQYSSATAPGQTSTSQHAAVPGSHATTVTGQPHPLSGNNSSHTGRELVGAGAAAGAGYEASRLAHHHNESTIGQGGSSLLQSGQTGTSSGLTGSHGLTGTTSHASGAPSTYSQESTYSQDPSSHTGRNVVGAGAAAGAGYEASRLAHHHNEPSIGQRDSSLQGTSTGQREGDSGPHNSRVANALDPRVDSDRDGSRPAGNTAGTAGTGTGAYNTLSDGTPSGVAASHLGGQSTSTTGNQADTTSRSATGGDGYNHLAGGTPSGISASTLSGQTSSTYGNQAGTTSHSKTSGGDNYNHLSSGTPSGVQLDAQPHSARAAGIDPSTSSSTTGTHNTSSGHGY